ncbi:MAG: bifunctional demethylmenaquinone methyltransferase/2-methoxy-6-polyprenyl-1,4-benzoquinol methylase UbiE [Syntrophales bacterium]
MNGSKRYRSAAEISAPGQIGAVKEIFSTITGEYDFLNHLLSLRRDIAWRKFAVRKMRFPRTGRLLDIATGTADLAIEAASHDPSVGVVGIDISREMLCRGFRKIRRHNLCSRIQLMQADALHLPFPDHSFDLVSMAFGIRNIPNKTGALREMQRVTCPGGQIMILEMTLPRGRWTGKFYSIYLRRILPLLARPFTKNPAAYIYLADTISRFPSPDSLARIMESAGLTDVEFYPLSGGITCLHVGKVPNQA